MILILVLALEEKENVDFIKTYLWRNKQLSL